VLIALRALYGIAMGGEWGIGASLAIESIPPKLRGFVSGVLQAGYPSGYLLASVVFFALYPLIGWRGMFMVGVLPALLVLYIRRHVGESPVFERRQKEGAVKISWRQLRSHAGLFVWTVLMMASFNFLSHGTQDIYPTFLEQQRGLSSHTVGIIAVVYNIGAILGGICFGIVSEKFGRRRSILAAALLVLPAIPLWCQSKSVIGLAAGAFLVQFFAQGAWGIVPVHLNEISPDALRGTFPGLAYQLGNLIASGNATLQAGIAAAHGDNYALALALVAGLAAIAVGITAGLSRESRGKKFGEGDIEE
jgi:SHS family lactate transporter-like MFS transporter